MIGGQESEIISDKHTERASKLPPLDPPDRACAFRGSPPPMPCGQRVGPGLGEPLKIPRVAGLTPQEAMEIALQICRRNRTRRVVH